jgi:hypothetical protein
MKKIYLVVTKDVIGNKDTIYHGAFDDLGLAEQVCQDFNDDDPATITEVVETQFICHMTYIISQSTRGNA